MVLDSSLDIAQNFFQPALAGDSLWVLDRLQPARCWIFNFPASALLEKNKGARFQQAPSQLFKSLVLTLSGEVTIKCPSKFR
jgi:hypothetical protein